MTVTARASTETTVIAMAPGRVDSRWRGGRLSGKPGSGRSAPGFHTGVWQRGQNSVPSCSLTPHLTQYIYYLLLLSMSTGTPSSTRREKKRRSSSDSRILRIILMQVVPPQLRTEQLFG